MCAPDRPGRPLATLALLWLAGAGLRLTVLAVPPVIPLLHRDLHLSETGIGVLSSLPSLLFAAAAVPGSLLISRVGARRTLVAGLALTALAGALRGASPDTLMLFATTFLMGAGIAVMQPSLPPLARDWMPQRIGFATAVYANGLLVGEILSVSLTLPLVLPLAGGSWRLSFAACSLPVLATAMLVGWLAPRAPAAHSGARSDGRRWWPDWRDPRTWRIGLVLGSVNALYFATNAFLPDYLHRSGHAELIGPSLTLLSVCQLPASFLMLAFAERLTGRRWPFVAVALLCLASVLGIVLMPYGWVPAWSGLLGFSCAFGLVLSLALPPLLARPDDVHRLSAGMFTISYSCAVAAPIVGGWAWDATGIAAAAFAPGALLALLMAILASGLDLHRHTPAARAA
ncbi:MAG: MFS transporter [Betaproteobacteria bacterium]|nr:MFS transporter [Betaproteobacteria bacterium]